MRRKHFSKYTNELAKRMLVLFTSCLNISLSILASHCRYALLKAAPEPTKHSATKSNVSFNRSYHSGPVSGECEKETDRGQDGQRGRGRVGEGERKAKDHGITWPGDIEANDRQGSKIVVALDGGGPRHSPQKSSRVVPHGLSVLCLQRSRDNHGLSPTTNYQSGLQPNRRDRWRRINQDRYLSNHVQCLARSLKLILWRPRALESKESLSGFIRNKNPQLIICILVPRFLSEVQIHVLQFHVAKTWLLGLVVSDNSTIGDSTIEDVSEVSETNSNLDADSGDQNKVLPFTTSFLRKETGYIITEKRASLGATLMQRKLAIDRVRETSPLENNPRSLREDGFASKDITEMSCGGGISRQQRRCRRKPCKGRSWSTKYKICNPEKIILNMDPGLNDEGSDYCTTNLQLIKYKPCENPSDFRTEQCAAFDDVPYSGQLLKWYPHYDPTRPCALICRGEQSLENTGSRLRQETSVEKTLPRDATDALQLDSEETIVVQLADKVDDGTKCYADSMDVCIGGECMVSD
ncbi:ADAMTS-like protein 3 [Melipona quadrifasciata]|uniref:ADAMTS-like protein 3 n=1 Tax=Melipona quadrifasciata TaxID=166423 RepID=A0A0N0BDV7_9HYME|nr:ADAMTS-like protein 3 [Melipona quadrifasciata]